MPILLMEDEVDNRINCTQLLEEKGYIVRGVSNGREASTTLNDASQTQAVEELGEDRQGPESLRLETG